VICELVLRRLWLVGVALLAVACGENTDNQESPALGPDLFLSADQAAINNALLELELDFQEGIARCIAGTGFDYIPKDDSSETSAANEAFRRHVGDDFEQIALGTPASEYAAEWGYGIARRFLDLPADQGSALSVDPNADYVEGLTSEEANAYAAALGDCEQEGASIFAQIEEFQSVAQQVQIATAERLRADARIVELNRDWSRCLAESGVLELLPSAPSDPQELRLMVQSLFFESDSAELALEEFLGTERIIASAAVRCAEPLSYADVFLAAESDIQEQELSRLGYE